MGALYHYVGKLEKVLLAFKSAANEGAQISWRWLLVPFDSMAALGETWKCHGNCMKCHGMATECVYGLLWKEFFRDPSQWWDNRKCKVVHAIPHFKHKVTEELLWVDDCYNPPWVSEELRRRGLVHAQDGGQNEGTAFVALLRDCAKHKDLCRGSRVHDDILRRGLLEKCSDALVIMYAKCGALAKARDLFDMHKSTDVSTWTALIGGYARKGEGQNALNCFERMRDKGLYPDAVTFISLLKACASVRALDKGKELHDEIAKLGLLHNDVMLGNALVNMYAKCGALAKARQVLGELPSRNVISWNAMIVGYAEYGDIEQALDCFERMRQEGLSPNAVTFICLLKVCGKVKAVDEGERVYDEVAKHGFLGNNLVIGNALVDMYAKCGALAKARQVLEELPRRDVVSWTALISGYAEHGEGAEALKCYEKMQHEDLLLPDAATFICVLKACGSIKVADKGQEVHDWIAKRGLMRNNIALGNALVDMYAKCGAIAKARRVLEELPVRDIMSWTALISACTACGEAGQALNCFEEMQYEGLSPDAASFVSSLKACGSIGAADMGQMIHEQIAEQHLLRNDIGLSIALVDMYAKCGALQRSRQVLEELPVRDVISWTALISGYAEHGDGDEALICFEQMQDQGFSPDGATFACILKACGSIGAADKGEEIHHEITKQGLLASDRMLGVALVDMYVKCGALAKARQVLKKLPVQDLMTWTALIAGYAGHGEAEQALTCFEEMQCMGVSPDAATLSSLLSACCRSARVQDAHMYFVNMTARHGIKPDMEHYTCMVDLFGRVGQLDKAIGLIEKLPSSSVLWSCLLDACQRWGDVEVGRWAFDNAVQVDKSETGAYVLMAKFYAAAGMQEDAKNIEAMRIQYKAGIIVRGSSPSRCLSLPT